MTQRQRRRLFLALVFCFFVAAPAITLWSQGYRFDWREKSLTQVGGLYLKVTPRDAKLSIEEIGTRALTPTLLSEGYLWSNILPGTYEIKIFKEGYLSWTKSASINPLQVTKFTSVLLFPETPAVESLETIRASDFWPAGRSSDSFYFSDDTGRQLFYLERDRRNSQPLPIIGAGTNLQPLRSRILEVKPSPDDSVLLVTLADDILVLRRGKQEIFSLMPYVRRLGLAADNFTTLLWNPAAPAELIAAIRERIYIINIADASYRRIMADDAFLGTNTNGTALLGASGNLYRPGGADGVEQFDRVALEPPQNKMTFRIGTFAGRRYLLLDKNGDLWQASAGSGPKLVSKNALDFWIDPGRSRVAILSKDQVLSVYFPAEENADVVYPAGTILKLGLVENRPENIFWLGNNWHLLLRYPEKLEVVEIDSRSPIYRVSYPINSVRAAWSRAENALVYLSQNSFWIWRLL